MTGRFARFLVAIALAALPTVATAQAPKPVTFAFVMPTGVDPVFFDFTFNGETFNIPGNDFLPVSEGGLGGVAFDVPHSVNGLEFTDFDFTFNFQGTAQISPHVGANFSQFASWLAPDGVVSTGQTMGVDATIGSALVGQNDPNSPGQRFFAAVLVTGAGSVGLDAFRNSTITVTGHANFVSVPESGSLVLLVCGLPVLASPFAYRRLKRR